MILGFIIGLGVAYLLTIFHIDQTIISGVRDIIRIDIGNAGYFLLMGIIGGISRVMIGGFVTGLIVAYMFTFIKLNQLMIEVLKEWFKYDMSLSGYYLLFATIGAALSLLKVVRKFLKPIAFLAKKIVPK